MWVLGVTPPLPVPLRRSTVLMFPSELGGASLSSTAYQRLQQCPVADPPCADQQVGAGGREGAACARAAAWLQPPAAPLKPQPAAPPPLCAVLHRVWHAGPRCAARQQRPEHELPERQVRARLRCRLRLHQRLRRLPVHGPGLLVRCLLLSGGVSQHAAAGPCLLLYRAFPLYRRLLLPPNRRRAVVGCLPAGRRSRHAVLLEDARWHHS